MARLTEDAFERRIARHLRDHHADALYGVSNDVLLRMVRAGVVRARSHSLSWESSIMTFVALMFEVAPDFDEHPAIRSALRDAATVPDERLAVAVDRLAPHVWQEASSRADLRAWFGPRAPDEP